uniref:Beta-defensin n=1 Tax=Ursus americanus TaxID=9643 RepID=A0A452QFE8_URSAM
MSCGRMRGDGLGAKMLAVGVGSFNFERPCYLRGGICLKQGTPNCEPFRGPCRAFTVCCKVKRS